MTKVQQQIAVERFDELLAERDRLKAKLEAAEQSRERALSELSREQEKLKLPDEAKVRENIAFLMAENNKLKDDCERAEKACAAMREALKRCMSWMDDTMGNESMSGELDRAREALTLAERLGIGRETK